MLLILALVLLILMFKKKKSLHFLSKNNELLVLGLLGGALLCCMFKNGSVVEGFLGTFPGDVCKEPICEGCDDPSSTSINFNRGECVMHAISLPRSSQWVVESVEEAIVRCSDIEAISNIANMTDSDRTTLQRLCSNDDVEVGEVGEVVKKQEEQIVDLPVTDIQLGLTGSMVQGAKIGLPSSISGPSAKTHLGFTGSLAGATTGG